MQVLLQGSDLLLQHDKVNAHHGRDQKGQDCHGQLQTLELAGEGQVFPAQVRLHDAAAHTAEGRAEDHGEVGWDHALGQVAALEGLEPLDRDVLDFLADDAVDGLARDEDPIEGV